MHDGALNPVEPGDDAEALAEHEAALTPSPGERRRLATAEAA